MNIMTSTATIGLEAWGVRLPPESSGVFGPHRRLLEYIFLLLIFQINDNAVSEELMGGTEVKGYPVSHGVVEGLARVVISFHDVNTIQPGEILITHATDIGWSPYFPMLAGVVTEIGGLISHGAVIAREFGLPCIIGAQNATRVFKSGDRVVLNATKGTVTKLQHQA